MQSTVKSKRYLRPISAYQTLCGVCALVAEVEKEAGQRKQPTFQITASWQGKCHTDGIYEVILCPGLPRESVFMPVAFA